MQKKQCRGCGQEKGLDEFYKEKLGKFGRRSNCIECYNSKLSEAYYADHEKSKASAVKHSRAWRANNAEASRSVSRRNQIRHAKEIRQAVLKLLGEHCQLCREDDLRVLHIDHVHGGGCQARKESSSLDIWKSILIQPDGYRVLCANCNHLTRLAEIAPPKTKSAVYSQKHRLKLRLAATAKLGDCCAKCKNKNSNLFCIDHLFGNGRADRARFVNENQFFKDVVDNPWKYQLLCHNCNWIKRHERREVRQ